ncbi:hypothetical protein AB1N83_007805 [Pleurotus pulmonarius]
MSSLVSLRARRLDARLFGGVHRIVKFCDIEALRRWVWVQYPKRNVLAEPRNLSHNAQRQTPHTQNLRGWPALSHCKFGFAIVTWEYWG